MAVDQKGSIVDVLASLVIIGTAMGILVLALLAWAGIVLFQRVLGLEPSVPTGERRDEGR